MIDKLREDLDEWDNQDAAAHDEARPQPTRDIRAYPLAMETVWISNYDVLLITSSGRLAVGTGRAQLGDSIVVLLGGDMPFVLRRHSDGKHWKRVGMAWVAGIMDGELVKDPTSKRQWYSLI